MLMNMRKNGHRIALGFLLSLTALPGLAQPASAPASAPTTKPPAVATPAAPSAAPMATPKSTPMSGIAKPPQPPQVDGLLTLTAARTTLKQTDSVIVELNIKAIKPLTLCLNDKQPQDNVHFNIYRGGYGQLNSTPEVVKPSNVRPKQILLKPNQSMRWAVNLTQISGVPLTEWQPGEYRIQAKFYPCGSANTQTPPLNSKDPLFLLLRH